MASLDLGHVLDGINSDPLPPELRHRQRLQVLHSKICFSDSDHMLMHTAEHLRPDQATKIIAAPVAQCGHDPNDQ